MIDFEAEYEALMATARENLDPSHKRGEVVVLKTTKGNTYVTKIPDYEDHITREPLENACIARLAQAEDTVVSLCIATINGKHPEILSWNFRKNLIELDPENLQTNCYLWGGGDDIILKPFSRLL